MYNMIWFLCNTNCIVCQLVFNKLRCSPDLATQHAGYHLLAIPICRSADVAEHCSSQAQIDWALVMLTQVQAQHSLDAECAQELQAPNRTVANSPATQQEIVQAPNRAVANAPATQPNSKQV